ncbi:MAG: ABC transporter [Clostridiales bacterium]|nr:MAG: ABC transporter [Clostridiales bacterium]
MIEIRNLVKRYGDHVAVDHLNLALEEGKVYGFLGPNGAGKSTTMNIMTGYLSATEGDVVVNGHSILDEPEEAKACIGYLPELPPLYQDMTVTEYLAFCAELKRVPPEERTAQLQKVVHMTRLEAVAGRLIANLSKGYRQRVGLAQAILGFPPILILDEPTVGLDPKQIIEIRGLISDLAREHTVVLSSHILSEIQAVCDQIIIIHHGKLLANDTPDRLEESLGGSQLHLTVRGDRETVEALLTGVPGVTVTQAEQEGDCTYAAVEMGKEDPRERLFYACAERRLPILDMHQDETSLEQVFLRLTSDAVVAPPPKKRRGFRSSKGGQPEETAVAIVPAQEETHKEVSDQ